MPDALLEAEQRFVVECDPRSAQGRVHVQAIVRPLDRVEQAAQRDHFRAVVVGASAALHVRQLACGQRLFVARA